MNYPKYVITEFNGMDFVHVLPITRGHCDVVHHKDNVVSAGFFKLYVNDDGKVDVECFGRSTSLKVLSRGEEDVPLLRQFFELER